MANMYIIFLKTVYYVQRVNATYLELDGRLLRRVLCSVDRACSEGEDS